jgi:signal peptidase I
MRKILLGKSWVSAITRIACLSTFIIFFAYPNFELIRIDGNSMYPTLHHGDVSILHKTAYSSSSPVPDDIVMLIDDDGDSVIKRLIAGPGDLFEIHDYVVYVNGTQLDDQYGKTDQYKHTQFQRLVSNEYIYFGDNRSETSWGRVLRENIKGKILFVE